MPRRAGVSGDTLFPYFMGAQGWRKSEWFRAISDTSTFISISQVAGAGAITWIGLVRWVMQSTTNAAVIWVATITIFCGSFASAILVTRMFQWSAAKIKRWWNPHSLAVVAHGGDNASVGITHSGEPATWEVRRRIVRPLYDRPNPDPHPRLCYLCREGRTHKSLLLRQGESASVVIGTPFYNQFHSRPWITLPDAESSGDVHIDNEGAILELEIKSTPPTEEGAMHRCFKILRPNPYGPISLEDIVCEK